MIPQSCPRSTGFQSTREPLLGVVLRAGAGALRAATWHKSYLVDTFVLFSPSTGARHESLCDPETKKEGREKRGRSRRSSPNSLLLILTRGREWLKQNLHLRALVLLIIIPLITRPVISQHFYHPLFSLYSPKSQGPIEWVSPCLKFLFLFSLSSSALFENEGSWPER